ncbi:CAP domain-containing protein [Candidatus Saccharibacteria bacterium]|nr:CAP domain-containing protein [Candidatus Saccharibacteria bacterium]
MERRDKLESIDDIVANATNKQKGRLKRNLIIGVVVVAVILAAGGAYYGLRDVIGSWRGDDDQIGSGDEEGHSDIAFEAEEQKEEAAPPEEKNEEPVEEVNNNPPANNPSNSQGQNPPAQQQSQQPQGTQIDAMGMLAMINAARFEVGESGLVWSASLAESAGMRAVEICEQFAHTRPDGRSWMSINPLAFGENIAAGQGSVTSAFNDWMISPGHRSNILNSGFNSIGVAGYYCPGSAYGYYWVQLFGR